MIVTRNEFELLVERFFRENPGYDDYPFDGYTRKDIFEGMVEEFLDFVERELE